MLTQYPFRPVSVEFELVLGVARMSPSRPTSPQPLQSVDLRPSRPPKMPVSLKEEDNRQQKGASLPSRERREPGNRHSDREIGVLVHSDYCLLFRSALPSDRACMTKHLPDGALTTTIKSLIAAISTPSGNSSSYRTSRQPGEDLNQREDWLFQVVFDHREHYTEDAEGQPTSVFLGVQHRSVRPDRRDSDEG